MPGPAAALAFTPSRPKAVVERPAGKSDCSTSALCTSCDMGAGAHVDSGGVTVLSLDPDNGTDARLKLLQEQFMRTHALMVEEIKKAADQPANESDSDLDALRAKRDANCERNELRQL